MKFELINWFLSLSRVTKRLLMICIDILLIIVVLLLSFSVRLGEWFWPQGDLVYLIFFAPLIAIPIFIKFGLYRAIVRYIGFEGIMGNCSSCIIICSDLGCNCIAFWYSRGSSLSNYNQLDDWNFASWRFENYWSLVVF